MTMTRQSGQTGQSISPRQISDDQSPNLVTGSVIGADPSSIKAVLLTDGNWHNVEDCKLVQFAVGQAQSPISATKLFPYLSYTESGRQILTAIGQVVSFDIEMGQQQSST